MSSRIMLYSGTGADPFCTQALENQLKDLSDDRVHNISRFEEFSSIRDGRDIKAIAIPGGNANHMYFFSDLRASEEIFKRTLDQHRISYYGACAGAILASSSIYYGTSLETVQNAHTGGFNKVEAPLLSLFPGKTIAPLFPKAPGSKISLNDFHLPKIKSTYRDLDKPIASAHIMGPALLLEADRSLKTEVLTTYEKLPNLTLGTMTNQVYTVERDIPSSEVAESIYYERYSGSSLVLTSSHLEIDSKMVLSESFKDALKITNTQQRELSDKIKVDDEARKALLKRNFQKLEIQCK